MIGDCTACIREGSRILTQSSIASCATCQTTFPPTMVATVFPLSDHPWNGLFLDLLAEWPDWKTHERSGSKTVTSASAPVRNVPLGSFNNFAGATVNFATRSGSD